MQKSLSASASTSSSNQIDQRIAPAIADKINGAEIPLIAVGYPASPCHVPGSGQILRGP
jgi:hypothetical protein